MSKARKNASVNLQHTGLMLVVPLNSHLTARQRPLWITVDFTQRRALHKKGKYHRSSNSLNSGRRSPSLSGETSQYTLSHLTPKNSKNRLKNTRKSPLNKATKIWRFSYLKVGCWLGLSFRSHQYPFTRRPWYQLWGRVQMYPFQLKKDKRKRKKQKLFADIGPRRMQLGKDLTKISSKQANHHTHESGNIPSTY